MCALGAKSGDEEMPPLCERRWGGRGCPVLREPRPRGAAAVLALNPEAILAEGYSSGTRVPAATAESSGVERSPAISGAPLKAGEVTSRETEPSKPAFGWGRRGLEVWPQVAKSDCPSLLHEETKGRGDFSFANDG